MLKPGVFVGDDEQADAAVAGSAGPHRGRDEVRAGTAGDERLGAVDDVGVPVALGPGAQARDVGAAVGFGDRERTDELAGQRGAGVAVDQVAVAAGHEMRQGDAVGEQRGTQAAGAAGLDQLLGEDGDVDRVPAGATCLFGEPDAQQPGIGCLAVQFPRHLLGAFPVGQVRHDLALREVPGQLTQRPSLVGPPGVDRGRCRGRGAVEGLGRHEAGR